MKSLGTLVIASVVMTAGCAAFKFNELPPVNASSYAVTNAQPVKVYSNWTGGGGAASPALQQKYFEAALRSSGCCDIVTVPEQADVVINGTDAFRMTPGAGIPAMLSGFTFGVIPSWATTGTQLRVGVTAGGAEHRYNVSDSATMVAWLPMILAMPFTGSPLTVEREMTENAYRTLVVKMKDDGLLSR